MARLCTTARAVFALAMLAPASATAQEAATLESGALYVLVPTTWVQLEAGARMRFAPPEAPGGDRVVFAVGQPLRLQRPFGEWFATAWTDFSRGYSDVQITNPVREMHSSAGHSWALITATMRDPAGQPLYVTFYAAGRGGVAQVMAYAGPDQTLFVRWASWMQDALENYVQFTDKRPATGRPTSPLTAAELFPTVAGAATPAPTVPGRTARIYGTPGGSPLGDTVSEPLDGIYGGLARGTGYDAGVSRDFVTFYPDGRVYRRLPEGGLEGFNRDSAERAVPTLWGRYERVSPGTWRISWNESEQVSAVEREGDALRYDGNLVSWLPACAGQTLDGRFEVESPTTTFPWAIAFTPDGQFRDDSLVGAVSYQDPTRANARQLDGGAGRYRVGRNTLHLDYDDGRRVLVAFHAMCDEAAGATLERIWINGTGLLRTARP